MKEDQIDVVFFNDPSTIHLLTGYLSEPHERILALMVFKEASPILFTPALDKEGAERIVSSMTVHSYMDTENPWQLIKQIIKSMQVDATQWAIEKQQLSVFKLEALMSEFPSSHFNHDYSPVIENLRIQKTPEEIEKMQKAGFWADEAIKIGARSLKIGVTELEVVAEIEYQLKKQGISHMSFDTMVLFGDNAANPHGTPGNRRLEENQFVLFDLGVMYKGFASDVTRTLFFGETPSEQQIEVYHTVLQAHDEAMKQASLSMTASELDGIARKVISDKGYGKYFNHRLGHGLGQGVHEFPSIMDGNDMKLIKNMCFSIEPGIYIQNEVGVRIEDCGYIDEDGFHSFTFFPTEISAYVDFIK
ncbi:aminopeptidase P family protein [Jeotgalibaca sp. A122]|uniref:aminopeptidase P family protein n=1 Tax=Jeotgalibaca sp. A122 TaxID=3457322 RepID=UPI003FD6753F